MSKKEKKNNERDTFFFEKKAKKEGYEIIAGVDEAGRGPLAGPVVAGAVIVNNKSFTTRIDDSKKLTERMREKALIDILKRCDTGIGVVGVEDIDRLNIYNATLMAMKKAVKDLDREPDYLLIDGNMNILVPQSKTCLIKGETLSVSIACASIVAKVFRDRMMMDIDKKYPEYGFKRHKGYGTREHIEAIKKHGLCPIHRKSFGPFGGRKTKQKGSER